MNELLRTAALLIWLKVLPPVIEVEANQIEVDFLNRDFFTRIKLDDRYGEVIRFVYRKEVVSGVVVWWRLEKVGDLHTMTE